MTTTTRPADRLNHTTASHRGEAAKELRAKFPPRVVPDTWPATMRSREEILGDFTELRYHTDSPSTRLIRRHGTSGLLDWLEAMPGNTWQARWQARGALTGGADWVEAGVAWNATQGRPLNRGMLQSGLMLLICHEMIRPDLAWVVKTFRSRHWRPMLAAHRDPEGFARLEHGNEPETWSNRLGLTAQNQIAMLLAAKGGLVSDITVGDCLELRKVERDVRANGGSGRSLFYALLKNAGFLPDDAPETLLHLNRYAGQRTVAQLVDRYGIECEPVKTVIIDYLAEREPALDYTTLDDLSRNIALHFWRNLEIHRPGIHSLRLRPEDSTEWKERLHTRIVRRKLPDGTVSETTQPRRNRIDILTSVRAFYLDIAEWALEDPARWGPWAAPSPISDTEITHKKHLSHRKSRMDQRTRERLPGLPRLIAAAEQNLHDARLRLAAALKASRGETFTALGKTFAKARNDRDERGTLRYVFDTETGRRRDFGQEEHRAFWGWAAIEVLRHTGIRIEELLEISHHAITQYRTPNTGELIPLLQIAPSKTDQERLLVVTPELADVLSTIVTRVRGDNGALPLVPFWDTTEKVWNQPMPLLFQWRTGGQNRAVSANSIRRAINEVLFFSGLTDAGGTPLNFTPHDFRRLFTTDAILNGMPPHIAQLLLGHKNINTTMGYKAIYPQEAINGHRAFIARRRSQRPSPEYRAPTDEEWNEFLGHFERRKVALGDCGRAYGTSCQHEHSCVRCPLLRVDPAQRPRLEEIRANLTDRITEAEREGWLGEAEGLKVSLAATEGKLAQLEERLRRATSINLGIPTFREIASRTATLPS